MSLAISTNIPIEKEKNITTLNKQVKNDENNTETPSIQTKDKNNINNKSFPKAQIKIDIVENKKDTYTSYEKTFYPIDKNIKKNPKEEIFYVNGILTKPKGAEQGATEISNLINKPITLLYNPTEGFIKDLLESVVTVAHLSKNLKIVDSTAKKFYETLKDGKDLKIIGHSQGASIIAAALTKVEKEFINEGKSQSEIDLLMKKVTVVTIGGASSKEDFPSKINLVERKSSGDLVPKVAGKTSAGRPEDILYQIQNTNDVTKKESLWKKYFKKAEERTLGRVGNAIGGAFIGGACLIGEYTSIKTGIAKPPSKSKKELDVIDVKIVDVVNKYHSVSDYDSGYLKNPQDCKAITDALC